MVLENPSSRNIIRKTTFMVYGWKITALLMIIVTIVYLEYYLKGVKKYVSVWDLRAAIFGCLPLIKCNQKKEDPSPPTGRLGLNYRNVINRNISNTKIKSQDETL